MWDRITANLQPPILTPTDWIPDLAHPVDGECANINTDLVLPGVVSGGALVTPLGVAGQGMRFTGKLGCMVETVPTSNGAPPCTYMAWFRSVSTLSQNEWILSKGATEVFLAVNAGTLRGGTNTHVANSAINPRDGLLHLVAVTITGTGETFLHLDGPQVATNNDGVLAQTSVELRVGAHTNVFFPWNGDIYAPAIHSGIVLTPSQIAAEWNRYLQAKNYYQTPDGIERGTYSTADTWIGGTPWLMHTGTLVVENTGVQAPFVQARATVSAAMSLYADGHLNGCLGPEVEGYGHLEFWHTNGGSSHTYVHVHNDAADTVRLDFRSDGTVRIHRVGVGAYLATFNGANTIGQRRLWRIEISKNLATGYQVILWRDGVLLTADTGSNPTAHVAATLTQPQLYVDLRAGNSLGLDGFHRGPSWRVAA